MLSVPIIGARDITARMQIAVSNSKQLICNHANLFLPNKFVRKFFLSLIESKRTISNSATSKKIKTVVSMSVDRKQIFTYFFLDLESWEKMIKKSPKKRTGDKILREK